jgi:hypothetical protein
MFRVEGKFVGFGGAEPWIERSGNIDDVNEAKNEAISRLGFSSYTILRVVAVNPAGRVIRIIASYEDPEAV